MTEGDLRELCPLAALGALDGADRLAFASERSREAAVAADLATFERLVGLIGVATTPVPPSLGLRARVLTATGPDPRSAAMAGTATGPPEATPPLASRVPSTTLAITSTSAGAPVISSRPWAWLPWAVAAGLAFLALVWRTQRDDALRQGTRTAAEAETLTAQNRDLRNRLDTTRRRLDEAAAFRALVANPGSRVAGLAGLPAAPAARGRVVWNADRREAVLLATGLPVAPPGRAYEAWILAGGAPVAAGVFRAGEDGGAVHPLPRLDDIARAKTFAVTIEPENGTSSPTGPMVLAGPAL